MQKRRNIRINSLILNWAVRCYSMDNFFFICNFFPDLLDWIGFVVEFAKNQHKDLASKERTRYSILIYLLKIKNTKNIQNSNKWVLKKLTKQNIHFLFWTFQVVTKAK